MSRNAPSTASVPLDAGNLGLGVTPYSVSRMTPSADRLWVSEAINFNTHKRGYRDEVAGGSFGSLPTTPAARVMALTLDAYP